MGKLSCLWEDGVYLGVRGQSGELIVSDQKGVWKTRTVQRKPFEDRWPGTGHEMIIKVPWAEEEGEKADETEKLVTEMTEGEKEAEKHVEPEDKVPARFYIRKMDLEKHGYTANCPGCKAVLRGTTKQKHSEACRARFLQAMADDDRVKKNTRKIEEYEEKKTDERG